ncbi:MAG: DNA mismatch repair protein MutS [Clostridium sp.]|uniref:MutS-related protein n=1 Tax=Clostridium sp. TaxID=1506 RepID=UPI0025B940D8|nr:DNA mismatch repair protein MutS [Clostridium sp.]MBS4958549.1 DNA mismatch repair protein MutS [Clostridium sp.]
MIYYKKSLNVLKKYYKDGKYKYNYIKIIREFFDMQGEVPYTIDEQCFNDLDLENVFRKIDRTYSSVGEAVLYKMLREPLMDEAALRKRNKVIFKINDDKELRAKIQYIFHNLGFDKKNRFLEMMKKDLKSNKLKGIFYSLFGISNFILIIFMFLTFNKYIAFLVFLFFIIAPNIVSYESKKVSTNGLIYLNEMLTAAQRVVELDKKANLDTKKLKILLDKLSFIRINTWLINLVAIYGGILEPFLVPFLILESSYYRVIENIKENKNELLELYYELGKIEAFISIGIYKEIVIEKIYEPKFVKEIKLKIEDGIHPLLENPVSNSIFIEKKGIVLTGTNMSGKSTFLRMIGINVLLAQTFYFTLSSKYEAPFLNIVTSISPKDDIILGKSYYLSEVESIFRIINALDDKVTPLCIVDEIFRGTNPIERISSSTAILNYINKRSAITFVTTHDKELTHALKDIYDFYYFSEDVDCEKGLYFDYKLKGGIVKSRNAIKLLEYMGYPIEIIEEAMSLTELFEK